MRRFAFAVLAAVGLWIAPAGAHAETAKVSLPVEKTTLKNGLEVILHEDRRTPIVTVNVWYHVGSKDEPPGKNGFAHLFEHVMFQGSKHVPEDTYFRFLESAGASNINGTTSPDRTNYFETVPANRLELALWLESDRMGFLLDHVDQETFASQRDVVKNERRQNYENSPYGMVRQFIAAAMYPEDHPYHRLTIGTPQDLDAASLEDVKAFFRTWYVPNNATLVIAGDIDKAKALGLAEKYFGPIPSGPPPTRAPVPEVKLTGETHLDVASSVALGRVYVSWPSPAFFAAGDAELDLLAHVLASGRSSRLYKRLVDELRIAKDVRAQQESAQLGSMFQIVATAQRGHTADELQKAIDAELTKLQSGGITAAELAQAKASIVSGNLFRIERNAARADMLNTYNQYVGDPNYLERDLARYEGATPEAVLNAAKTWLPVGRRVVTVVTPTSGAPVSGSLVKTSTRPEGK
jgi:predicted Zn-dependent peptidase